MFAKESSKEKNMFSLTTLAKVCAIFVLLLLFYKSVDLKKNVKKPGFCMLVETSFFFLLFRSTQQN